MLGVDKKLTAGALFADDAARGENEKGEEDEGTAGLGFLFVFGDEKLRGL